MVRPLAVRHIPRCLMPSERPMEPAMAARLITSLILLINLLRVLQPQEQNIVQDYRILLVILAQGVMLVLVILNQLVRLVWEVIMEPLLLGLNRAVITIDSNLMLLIPIQFTAIPTPFSRRP